MKVCTKWHYEYKKVSAQWEWNDRFNDRARETLDAGETNIRKVASERPPDRDAGDADFRGKSSRYTKMSRKFQQFPISPPDESTTPT